MVEDTVGRRTTGIPAMSTSAGGGGSLATLALSLPFWVALGRFHYLPAPDQ